MYPNPPAICLFGSSLPIFVGFKQSKHACICVKFGTHVLWHNTHGAHFFYFFEILPCSLPGGEIPPKISTDFKQSKKACICVKFGTHVFWHNTNVANLLFIFKIFPRSPPGGEIPPKIPHIEISSNFLEI